MNQSDPNAPKAETPAQLKKRLAKEAEAAAANSTNKEQNEQTNTEVKTQNTGQDGQNPPLDPVKESSAGDSNKPKADENNPGTQITDEQENKLIQTEPTLGTAATEEATELGPLDLRITNSGSLTHCNVTKTEIPPQSIVTITYQNAGRKALAKRNFAQLNALAGKKRFQVEG
nr:hypothetical protein [uncultured Acinetobacter sp.]